MLRATLATIFSVFVAVPLCAEPPDVETILDAVNERNLGEPGWRRVQIDILNNGVAARTFVVTNVWLRQAGDVQTLFYLEQPRGLTGTSYLELEQPRADVDLKVFLNLPTSRGRVLSIAPEDLGEGLLGSDFGYSDLRMVLPRASCGYRFAGRGRMLGREVVAIEATPRRGTQLPWARAVLYIDPSIGFVLGADYFTGGPAPGKRMRVDRLGRIGGVWTAERMTMSAGPGRATRITLLDARFHLAGISASLMNPAELPRAGERIMPLARGGGTGR